jgi:hypothetical protein
MFRYSIIFCAVIVFFFSCKKDSDNNNNVPLYKISYNIGCTDCEVIYVSDSLGNQSTEYHQNSSWSYSFHGKKNQEVLMLAYNTSDHAQGVTATIMLNDTVLKSRTTYCAISGISFVVDTIR